MCHRYKYMAIVQWNYRPASPLASSRSNTYVRAAGHGRRAALPVLLLLPGLSAVRPVRASTPPVYRVRLLRGPGAMASPRRRRAGQERGRGGPVARGVPALAGLRSLRAAGAEPPCVHGVDATSSREAAGEEAGAPPRGPHRQPRGGGAAAPRQAERPLLRPPRRRAHRVTHGQGLPARRRRRIHRRAARRRGPARGREQAG
uniref:Uncharacterized protein n=1 Tax=Triticum urartu TaxID=4572 RepID=A0A8R7QH19_TRIUA